MATTASDEATAFRLEHLIARFGNNGTARLLWVSPSQPSRWKAGTERPSPESERRLIDLDYVAARLDRLYTPRLQRIWLESHHPALDARPIDVLLQRGPAAVLVAIDRDEQGAYA